jgi:hypothetical protein
MDSKVTALERAFQLARSGRMVTIDDIKKRLKQEATTNGQWPMAGRPDNAATRAYQGGRD